MIFNVDHILNSDEFSSDITLGFKTWDYDDKDKILIDIQAPLSYIRKNDVREIAFINSTSPLISFKTNLYNMFLLDTKNINGFSELLKTSESSDKGILLNNFITNNKELFDPQLKEITSFQKSNTNENAYIINLYNEFDYETDSFPFLEKYLKRMFITFLSAYSDEYYQDGLLVINEKNFEVGMTALAKEKGTNDVAYAESVFDTYSDNDILYSLFEEFFGLYKESFLENPKEGVEEVLSAYDLNQKEFSITIGASAFDEKNGFNELRLLFNGLTHEDVKSEFQLTIKNNNRTEFYNLSNGSSKDLLTEDNAYEVMYIIEYFIDSLFSDESTSFSDVDKNPYQTIECAFSSVATIEQTCGSSSARCGNAVDGVYCGADDRIESGSESNCTMTNEDAENLKCSVSFENPNQDSLSSGCGNSDVRCIIDELDLDDVTKTLDPISVFDNLRISPSVLTSEELQNDGKTLFTYNVPLFINPENNLETEGRFTFYYDDFGLPIVTSLNVFSYDNTEPKTLNYQYNFTTSAIDGITYYNIEYNLIPLKGYYTELGEFEFE